MTDSILLDQIGQRMKAFRLGAGLSPEELAKLAGISRAAIYRYESGQPPKVDTLSSIAGILGVSLPTLFGVGNEYISSAVSYFERMRQLEENVEHISVLFGPVSYLLTTDIYDEMLPHVLRESIPEDVVNRALALKEVEQLLEILHARKSSFQKRKPSIVSLVSLAQLQQFARLGFIGSHNPPGISKAKRRDAAMTEIENIIYLLRCQPIGVQIGIVVDSIPNSSYQLFKQSDITHVAVSPYSLGTFANVRIGVATITAAPEAALLYNSVTSQLWNNSIKGEEAAQMLESVVG